VQSLSSDSIGDAYRDRLSVQEYSGTQPIEGVAFIDLRQSVDDGGDFMELLRLDQNGALEVRPDMKVSQINYSRVMPGAIKAFHLHFNQEDIWFVPPTDRVLVGLLDVRKDSPSCGCTMRFVLGGGRTRLLYIPRGVAHGAGNIWQEPAQIIYFVNQHFSLEQPDERRLPWDLCGEAFWNIAPG
jgi:dTDP-4-dehydrorhamnose 3,5-epimerase